MGEAGRARAKALFDWAVVIRAYETLWDEQEAERKRWRLSGKADSRQGHGPAIYPRPEESFARHASLMLQGDSAVVAVPGAPGRLPALLASTLTAYVPEPRIVDVALLQAVLAGCAKPVPVSKLDEILLKAGVPHVKGRATLAWMLKYALLRVA